MFLDYFHIFSHSYGQRENLQGGGGSSAMQKRKLNYRFHNPNSAAATADYILKILIDANSEKVERAIQAAADQVAQKAECDEGYSS